MSAVRLRDGRDLAYAEYGAPHGLPVLFLPGAGCGRLMRFGDSALTARGIRLISVDRPGLGASTADPDKTLDSVADDVAALLDDLAGTPVPVVANSQGAPFGLALAATGRVERLVLASPIDEVAHPPITAQLPTPLRELVARVAADPAGAAALFSGFTAEGLFARIMADCPPVDRALYDDPAFRRLLRGALDDGFRWGAAGYARDTVLAMSRWPAGLFEAAQVPVTVLFGAHDRVHSPDLGRTLAGRLPTAHLEIVSEAGGSLLWSHSGRVLDAAVGT
ncbi:alpha/beta hydrolase [Mycobacterium sp. PS03-16]|uniref:alpha/beta fold hydrolase n=1 Tax=Mycobacterium sp. PS03-16 TaxID=2559611 RepID=UPI0010735F44|nr:alpha/beta hydrolase [Mycobacterium sp. PS03-16]TFV55791.1 alpha/beta hydrolase [Mycobacterium sp. PS03-16]